MPKRCNLAHIVIPITEPISAKDRQIATLRARLKGSDAYLNVVAELAFGAGRTDRLLMEARP